MARLGHWVGLASSPPELRQLAFPRSNRSPRGDQTNVLAANDTTIWVGRVTTDGRNELLAVDTATGTVDQFAQASFAPGHMCSVRGYFWVTGWGESMGPLFAHSTRRLESCSTKRAASVDLLCLVAALRGPTEPGANPDVATIVKFDPTTWTEGPEPRHWMCGVHDMAWGGGSLFVITTGDGPARISRPMNGDGLQEISAQVSRLASLVPGAAWIDRSRRWDLGTDPLRERSCPGALPPKLNRGVLPFAESDAGLWAVLGSPSGASVGFVDPTTGEIVRRSSPSRSPVNVGLHPVSRSC